MRNLILRTISGIFLIGLVAGSILWGEIAFFVLSLLIFTLSFLEFRNMFGIKHQLLFVLLLVTGQTLLLLFYLVITDRLLAGWLIALPLFLIVFFTLYTLVKRHSSLQEMTLLTWGMIWITGTMLFLLALGWIPPDEPYNSLLPASLLALVWTYDTAAYLFGKMLGRTLLWPSISPSKTWEGTTLGLLFAAGTGMLLYFITRSYSLVLWITLAILISIAAILGDLFESRLKREAGVKDSGNLIPGHGGVLDRFDSLMFAAPVMFGIISIWSLLS